MEEFQIDLELLFYVGVAVFWAVSSLISFLNKSKKSSKSDKSWISQIENDSRDPWDDFETAPEKENPQKSEESVSATIREKIPDDVRHSVMDSPDPGEFENDLSDQDDPESSRPEKEEIFLEEVISDEKNILSGFIFHEIIKPPRSKR